MALDSISFAHLNVATFTKVEIQQLILKRIGKQFQVLNLVETHMKSETEISLKRRFPTIEFYFNHGTPQNNRETHREGCKGLIDVKNFQIHREGRLSTIDFDIEGRPYRLTSLYAPSENETSNSLQFLKDLFTTKIIDPERMDILAGDLNCGLVQQDYYKYKNWAKYRPRTRSLIGNGCLEHQLVDPFREIYETHAVIEFSGFTYSGREKEGKPTVKSRINYFLITQELYDHTEAAEILEEEIPFTDHKMIRLKLNFFQFTLGSGYYRCQNSQLQDPEFCKIFKIQIEQRLRKHSDVKSETQTDIPKEKATEVLMEVTSLTTLVTMTYAKQKRLATSRDKRYLICSIKLINSRWMQTISEMLVLRMNLQI